MPLINAYVTTTMVGMLLTSQFVYVFVGYAYQQAFSAWFSSTYTQIRHSDTHKNLTISALLSTLIETNNVFVSICLFIYFFWCFYIMNTISSVCLFLCIRLTNIQTKLSLNFWKMNVSREMQRFSRKRSTFSMDWDTNENPKVLLMFQNNSLTVVPNIAFILFIGFHIPETIHTFHSNLSWTLFELV